jgi:hypothetical protein
VSVVLGSKNEVQRVTDYHDIRRLAAGFCNLAAIPDACGCMVVGCACSRDIDKPPTLAALKAAIRTPAPRMS